MAAIRRVEELPLPGNCYNRTNLHLTGCKTLQLFLLAPRDSQWGASGALPSVSVTELKECRVRLRASTRSCLRLLSRRSK